MADYVKTNSQSIPLVYLQPQASTTTPGGILGGGALTFVGTVSHPTVTYGAADATGVRRTKFTGSASAASGAGFTEAGTVWYGVKSGDGFDIVCDFDVPADIAVGASAFIGVMASPAALAGDASALTNALGIGYDSGDALTAQWSLISNASGTATKTAFGLGRSSVLGHNMQVRLRSWGDAGIQVIVKDFTASLGNTTGEVVLNTTVTTNLPPVETLLGFIFDVYNGAVAASAVIELQKLVISTRG